MPFADRFHRHGSAVVPACVVLPRRGRSPLPVHVKPGKIKDDGSELRPHLLLTAGGDACAPMSGSDKPGL